MRKNKSGVTLLELLVTLTITSIIIISLYQIFDLTQSRLRAAAQNSDKYEAVRRVTDIIRSDVSQMNPVVAYTGTNWSYGTFVSSNSYSFTMTNQFQDFVFFINQPAMAPTNWTVVGYRISNKTNSNFWTTDGVGTLYRWTTNMSRLDSNTMYGFIFNSIPTNNLHPILDNVVHFKVEHTSTNGKPSLVYIELITTDSITVERSRYLPSPQTYFSTNINTFYITKILIPVLQRENR